MTRALRSLSKFTWTIWSESAAAQEPARRKAKNALETKLFAAIDSSVSWADNVVKWCMSASPCRWSNDLSFCCGQHAEALALIKTFDWPSANSEKLIPAPLIIIFGRRVVIHSEGPLLVRIEQGAVPINLDVVERLDFQGNRGRGNGWHRVVTKFFGNHRVSCAILSRPTRKTTGPVLCSGAGCRLNQWS